LFQLIVDARARIPRLTSASSYSSQCAKAGKHAPRLSGPSISSSARRSTAIGSGAPCANVFAMDFQPVALSPVTVKASTTEAMVLSTPTHEQQHHADHDNARCDPLPRRDRFSPQRHAEKQRNHRIHQRVTRGNGGRGAR
jgi:hypothetical protein